MKKILFTIALFGLLAACNKKKIVISNLNDNHIEIMGHGGMGYSNLKPINTTESILSCLFEDADGSEIDIQLTADNQLVAFHNSDLEGNTNFTGKIRDYTWNQLKEARYNSTPQLNYKIMNVHEFFSTLGSLDTYTFTLDVKMYRAEGEDYDLYIEDFTDAVADLYGDFSIDETVFIESQDENFIVELNSKDPQIQQYIYPNTYENGLNIALDLGLRGISIDNDKITRDQVQAAHDFGLFVTLWGVSNGSQNLDAINKNPDMIQTDAVPNLVKTLQGL